MRGNGFTLIELILVVGLAAVIAAMAVPTMGDMLERNRAGALGREFFTSLSLARSTAVMTGKNVVVCKSPDGLGCATEGDWSQGWLIFEDYDKDKSCWDAAAARCSDGGRILQVYPAQAQQQVTLRGNENVRNLIVFNPQGKVAKTNGTLTLCRVRDNAALGGMVISTPGRVRKAESGDSTSCP
jgi:type IV fimbrial biogenesis protein FimT